MNARSEAPSRWTPHNSSGWAPPEGTVWLAVHHSDVVHHGQRHIAWASGTRLASLAQDIALSQSARRGYLPDSEENRRLTEVLVHHPEDFGVAGEPIVLGADHLTLYRAAGDSRITLEIHGVECLNGFQRLALLLHAFFDRDLSPGHLDRVHARVEIVTGDERAQARRLSYETQRSTNPAIPQDNLSRCLELARIRAEYAAEGRSLDWRRGIVADPHSRGHRVADIFRGLACLSTERLPQLANLLSTATGLDCVWSDLDGDTYRRLMNASVHAIGVQRAVETYELARQLTQRLDVPSLKGHEHLVRYAPDLVIWAAARQLPLHELHVGGRHGPPWDEHIEVAAFEATVRERAATLVDACRAVRPASTRFKGEVERLDVWLAIIERAGFARR